MGVASAMTLLNLALVVTCVGIAYRHLTSSVARLYGKSLEELLGAWGTELLQSPLTSEFRIRGPFQLTNIRLPKRQPPLSRAEFIRACERMMPGLYGEAIAILNRPRTTTEWPTFIDRLQKSDEDSFARREILGINDGNFGDPAGIRSALFDLFPDVKRLIANYDGFMARFERMNRRRNLRQFAVIAGVLCFGCNLTLNRLFSVANLNHTEKLFDESVARAIPSLIWHRHFRDVLSYLAGCAVPTTVLAALAELLDRKVFHDVGTKAADRIDAIDSNDIFKGSKTNG